MTSQSPVCKSVRGVPPARGFTDTPVRTEEEASLQIHWIFFFFKRSTVVKNKCENPDLDLNGDLRLWGFYRAIKTMTSSCLACHSVPSIYVHLGDKEISENIYQAFTT